MINPGNKKSIKILHLLKDKEKPSVLFENLVKGLAEKKFQQTICYLQGNSSVANTLGERFPEICLGEKKQKGYSPSKVLRLSKIIKQNRIDLVHCQRHKPTVYGVLGAWAAGKRVRAVTTVHGRHRTRNLRRKLINSILFKRASKIISVSNAVRMDILKTNPGLNPDKVVTVYNGIDLERFSAAAGESSEIKEEIGVADGEMIFGTVGRLTPVKGQGVLLDAFDRISRRFPHVHLVVVGAGSLEEALKSRASKIAVPERVHFLGHRKDIPDILSAIDCFVLPSFSEGHPLSLLEAMACEKVVVASRVGGVPEILSSPGLGLLCEPRSVESLAEAMERVCRMSEQKQNEMRKSSRKAVMGNYTTEKMVSATADVYRSALFLNG